MAIATRLDRLEASTVNVGRPMVTLSPSMPFLEFVRGAWSTLEPATVYQHNWHIDVIAEHLEAISRGELQDLLINVPPGFMKSLLVGVFWPAWEWTWQPWTRWLFTSYDGRLSVRDALKTRRLIESEWYRRRWGHVFRLTSDQNEKTRYENDRTGWRIASSVNGLATGEHAHRRVADDPHKVKDVESEAERESTVISWKETMTSRGIATSHLNARVMVMQRVHAQDVAADWVEREPHVHAVVLPNEYETDRPEQSCTIAEHDRRAVDGDLLWPAMVSATETQALKTTKLGPYSYAGQYQQRPTPRAGLILDPAWFLELPPTVQLGTWRKAMYFDTAESEKQTADYTASVTLWVEPHVDLPRFYIGDLYHKRVIEQSLDVAMAAEIARVRPHTVGVEERAFKQQAIRLLIDRVRLLLDQQYGIRDIPIQSVTVDTDKVLRASVIEPPARAGQFFANLRAPWWSTISSEMTTFPRSGHDDTIDALSGAVQLAYQLRALLQKARGMADMIRTGQTITVSPGPEPAPRPPGDFMALFGR